MLRIIAGCEIELNGSAFEDGEIRWIRGLVDDGGNAAVCCHRERFQSSAHARPGFYLTLSSFECEGKTSQEKQARLRLIFRNHSSFCSFLAISILRTVYGRPSSSRVMLIFWPLGVPDVYLVSREMNQSFGRICCAKFTGGIARGMQIHVQVDVRLGSHVVQSLSLSLLLGEGEV